jgi:hypothetical protein
MEDEQLKFAKSIDFSQVDKSDRVYVREILLKVIQFNEIMPPLTVIVHPTADHYNVVIKGWDQPLDDKRWYETFLNPETRAGSCDYINTTQTIPTDGEGKAVKVLKVARLGKASNSKRALK